MSCSVSVFSQTVSLGVLKLGIKIKSFFFFKSQKKSQEEAKEESESEEEVNLNFNEMIRPSKQMCSVHFKIMYHIFLIHYLTYLVSFRFLTLLRGHNYSHRVNGK